MKFSIHPKKTSMKGSGGQIGQVSRMLLVLMVVIFILIVAVYLVLRFAENTKVQDSQQNILNEPPKPVYDKTLGNVKFSFVSAKDMGNFLKAQTAYQNDVRTTDKFIMVTVSAQNKGKTNLTQYSWEVGDLIDSEGRSFVSINQKAYYFLPKADLCGSLLKPEFEPTPCVKLYEVSKNSEKFKVEIIYQPNSSKKEKQQDVLDIIVR